MVRIKVAYRSKWEDWGKSPRFELASQGMQASNPMSDDQPRMSAQYSAPMRKQEQKHRQSKAAPFQTQQVMSKHTGAVVSSEVPASPLQPPIGTPKGRSAGGKACVELVKARDAEPVDGVGRAHEPVVDLANEQNRSLSPSCKVAEESSEPSLVDRQTAAVPEFQAAADKSSSTPVQKASVKDGKTERSPGGNSVEVTSTAPKTGCSRENPSEDSTVTFTPSSRTISPASRPSSALPHEGDNPTPKPVQHKRTASLFSETEIAERKKAWNKIAMPQDLLLRKKPSARGEGSSERTTPGCTDLAAEREAVELGIADVVPVDMVHVKSSLDTIEARDEVKKADQAGFDAQPKPKKKKPRKKKAEGEPKDASEAKIVE
ncbi:hypothetical protein LIA77_10440 [Sarocladium implicatum]|nr:hypothetical protein LIA77_10440 [Sarocladium implicatum]